MTVPSVTFPIPQEHVKVTSDMLARHLSELSREAVITQGLLRMVRSLCPHPNAKNESCPDCGEDWHD